MEILLTDIVYREDLYPRFKPNPQQIQQYAENLDVLPPIEVNEDNILIDGYHRWKAYEKEKRETIPAIVTETKTEKRLLMLAVERNAKHGLQLSTAEKKKYAVEWYAAGMKAKEISSALSISLPTFNRFTKEIKKQQEEERNALIFDLWMQCYTEQEIAERVDITQKTVNNKIADFSKSDQVSENTNFRNFEPEIYATWKFGKATNEVRHFGNIPPEIIDNLLYYFTKPFDVVFDPFGGGGSTIDRCIKRNRRYYVSDLSPIPERKHDMRQHDITTGLPDDLPVPDFVFLDPPYWKQAEGKYSDKETDLGNLYLDDFLNHIGNIAKWTKRKWNNNRPDGRVAIIIGEYKNQGKFIDLPFLCYERISKYMELERRIQVPYSTQVHGGAFVKMAKEKKEILYLNRDLMIFKV